MYCLSLRMCSIVSRQRSATPLALAMTCWSCLSLGPNHHCVVRIPITSSSRAAAYMVQLMNIIIIIVVVVSIKVFVVSISTIVVCIEIVVIIMIGVVVET